MMRARNLDLEEVIHEIGMDNPLAEPQDLLEEIRQKIHTQKWALVDLDDLRCATEEQLEEMSEMTAALSNAGLQPSEGPDELEGALERICNEGFNLLTFWHSRHCQDWMEDELAHDATINDALNELEMAITRTPEGQITGMEKALLLSELNNIDWNLQLGQGDEKFTDLADIVHLNYDPR